MSKQLKHFVLKNVDPATIDDKYRFSIDFNLDRKDPPANCTRIDQGVTFIDGTPNRLMVNIQEGDIGRESVGLCATPSLLNNAGGGSTVLGQETCSATAENRYSRSQPLVSSAPCKKKTGSSLSLSSLSSVIDAPTIKVIHDALPKIPISVEIPIGDETHETHEGLDQPLQNLWSGSRQKGTVTLTYLDECKKEHECVATMTSVKSNAEQTLLHCFWCRHPFPYRPIGAPLAYVPNRLHKRYHSEITQDSYILRENINRLESVMKDGIENAPGAVSVLSQVRDYYITDGCFCSFNCALAFIKENRHDPKYTHSEMLLIKIYYEIYGSSSPPIEASPSWRLLRNYGGHLTIEDFRRNLLKIDYRPLGSVLLPSFRPIGFLFEKQVRI